MSELRIYDENRPQQAEQVLTRFEDIREHMEVIGADGVHLGQGDLPATEARKIIGPRAILVGSPDGLHVAFDANAVRMAKAWRGRFFDAKGSRDGRGGVFLEPLGHFEDRLRKAVAHLAAALTTASEQA